MRNFLSFLCFWVGCILSIQVSAVPAYPTKRTIVLPDGSTQTVQLVGDEFFHYFRAEDGRSFAQQADGSFRFLPSSEIKSLEEEGKVLRAKANTLRARKRVGVYEPEKYRGKKKGIVLLVSFSDLDFVTPNAQAEFNDFFNKKGYSFNGMAGSVADYFMEQSYGQLEVEFDVVGPYTLSKPMSYYGGDNENYNDTNAQAMVTEACRMADADVNFTDYDWNNDGEVDQIFIIYAGFGQNYGADANTIWPHASSIPRTTMDYVTLSTYACTSELLGKSGTTIAGIGTACHEFSHCLGLPDTYDTDYSGGNGMTSWDIMTQGSYNMNGYVPASYTAYERWQVGWLEPTEITEMTQIHNMKCLADAPEAYVLYNEGNRDEFYLLENRQLVGFDRGLPGHGLLVTHIDYDYTAWTTNAPNDNPNHQRITYIPASGGAVPQIGNGADPFPGTQNVRNLNDFTVPAATLYNNNNDGTRFLHKPIENITESADGLISFDAMLPELGIPKAEITRVDDQITVQWNEVLGADSYDVRYTIVPSAGSMEESCLFIEDFSGTYSKSNSFTDIGSNLDKYLGTPGFVGTNVYQSSNLLRLGTTSKQGELRSPVISGLNTGRMTLVLTLEPAKDAGETQTNVTIYTASGNTENITLTYSTQQTFVLHSELVYTEACRIKLACPTRCHVQYMAVYDGIFDINLNAPQKTRAGLQEQTQTVEGNSFTLTEIAQSAALQVEIRARSQYRYGRWSQKYELPAGATPILMISEDRPLLNQWYDLNGRRLPAEPIQPGIYIYNGKKVVK